MKSIWSIAITSTAALVGIGIGAGLTQSVVGYPALRGETFEAGKKLPAGITLTGAGLSARANELLGADVARLIQKRQLKNASRIMLENVAFQRDARAIYADFSIRDMVPGRSLVANLDMYDEQMRRIGSQPLPFVSTGSSQPLRIIAGAPFQATRFSVRISDTSGADVPLFSTADAADAPASVPPELPLFAVDSALVAELLVKLGLASPDVVISGQALRSILNDFRSLTELEVSSPLPTLRDLYALRALAGETGDFDVSGYYDWRLSSENLRAPRPRAEVPRPDNNRPSRPSVDDVVVEEDVTATIQADDDISAGDPGVQ